MASRTQKIERITSETQIQLKLEPDTKERSILDIPLPFFAHMLNAMAWHGGFYLEIKATGDIAVDPHHLVEDTGIALGQAFAKILDLGAVQRYGERSIPMDDALSQAIVDVCNRPHLVYSAEFPQPRSGNFDMSLFREFFYAFATNAKINLHLICHYGVNSHHMIEALFKAMGKALHQAYRPAEGETRNMSTKNAI